MMGNFNGRICDECDQRDTCEDMISFVCCGVEEDDDE